MSPFSRCGTRSAIILSTIAAGTMSHNARGFCSFWTRSCNEMAAVALSFARSSLAFADVSKTTQSCPPLMSRRTMFAPILPKPIIPSCMLHSSCGPAAPGRGCGSMGIFQVPITPDQRVRGAVMPERGRLVGVELRNDPLGQHLAELDAPLVERVDLPDRPLCEHAVLVKRDQLAERRRGQPVEQNGVGRPVALEGPVRQEPVGRALGLDLLP